MSTTPHLLVFLSLLVFSCTSHAQVPEEDTFEFVNEGDLVDFDDAYTEYDATFRLTRLSGGPFQLAWYNTTPDQFYIGLRMGIPQTDSLYRWVWDANRGRPVGENATLTFGHDGNLVLANANGHAVWTTGTANKGVIGIKILPTGNIVLYNKQGRFMWQSFNHPTDTLMVGQSLYVGGPTKLVSRRSATDNSDGIYSLVLLRNGVGLYVDTSPKPLTYSGGRFNMPKTVSNATLDVFLVNDGAAYEITLRMSSRNQFLARPKYNATFSILRLELDGNFAVYTYYTPVDYSAWERSYLLFSQSGDMWACKLPSKCGALGLCINEMCVACPTAKGLLGWSENCAPPTLGAPCTSGVGVDYYKVTGVEHFIPDFSKGLGKMRLADCRSKCSADCNCVGFFYWEETSQCWLAPMLGSLSGGVGSSGSHVLYIKYFK